RPIQCVSLLPRHTALLLCAGEASLFAPRRVLRCPAARSDAVPRNREHRRHLRPAARLLLGLVRAASRTRSVRSRNRRSASGVAWRGTGGRVRLSQQAHDALYCPVSSALSRPLSSPSPLAHSPGTLSRLRPLSPAL